MAGAVDEANQESMIGLIALKSRRARIFFDVYRINFRCRADRQKKGAALNFTSSRRADGLEEDTLHGAGVSAANVLIFGSLKTQLQPAQSPFAADTYLQSVP